MMGRAGRGVCRLAVGGCGLARHLTAVSCREPSGPASGDGGLPRLWLDPFGLTKNTRVNDEPSYTIYH